MTQTLETLISVEGTNLNLHDNLALVYYAFPDNLPSLASPPQLPTSLLWLAGGGV